MIVEFEDKERPVKFKQRIYSPEKLQFLKSKCVEFLRLGLIYWSLSSEWAGAPLMDPLKGLEGLQFVRNVHPASILIKRKPVVSASFRGNDCSSSGAVLFFLLDFIHGYWKYPPHPLSQKCTSLHTPFGVCTSWTVAHGANISLLYLQLSTEYIFNDLPLLIWLDGFLEFAPWQKELLDILNQSLTVCT